MQKYMVSITAKNEVFHTRTILVWFGSELGNEKPPLQTACEFFGWQVSKIHHDDPANTRKCSNTVMVAITVVGCLCFSDIHVFCINP
mmetsp:Transcript_14062/g.24043  ORF Transcript_14062/g.24043 Transcript_14062/m.24043 type:complete len:87 (-) Transcript_14062:1263-1523(-)